MIAATFISQLRIRWLFLLFFSSFLTVVKSTTDKLVPASMVQNEPVFKLHRDVVDTMISGAGGFAAILHRHRSADRFRRTVLVLASCVDGTPPQSAIGAASNTGRNSPRHVVDACHKLLFAIGAHKNGASGRTGRNFAGGVIVLAAPHSSSFWIHGRQIVDAGNSLATCTNRATGIVMQQRIDDVANGSLKLLFAVMPFCCCLQISYRESKRFCCSTCWLPQGTL